MSINIHPAAAEETRSWREMYRAEMDCQIVHDSLHARKGWTASYKLLLGDGVAGYGAVAVGGPWAGKPSLFEFYVRRSARDRLIDLFSALLESVKPATVEAQSNDPILTPLLHLFGKEIASEALLFQDQVTTHHAVSGAVFRQVTGDDATKIFSADREPGSEWVIELDGQVAATGGLLFHYNPPYGDIWMEVNELFRGRGLGALMVQELKRVCYDLGRKPAARCNPANVASRRTLQKAGFVPCGHILKAHLGTA